MIHEPGKQIKGETHQIQKLTSGYENLGKTALKLISLISTA